MESYEIFNFILCLCVFLLLTLFIGFLLGYIYRQSIKLIDNGVEILFDNIKINYKFKTIDGYTYNNTQKK